MNQSSASNSIHQRFTHRASHANTQYTAAFNGINDNQLNQSLLQQQQQHKGKKHNPNEEIESMDEI